MNTNSSSNARLYARPRRHRPWLTHLVPWSKDLHDALAAVVDFVHEHEEPDYRAASPSLRSNHIYRHAIPLRRWLARTPKPIDDPLPRARVQLIREARPYAAMTIRTPEDVWKLVRDELAVSDRERFLVLLLDGAHHVIAVHEATVGLADSCQIHPREVFKAAILANATRIIAVHNHPSGETTPSEPDRLVTERLRSVGDLIGIPLLDHVIVTAESHLSLCT